MPKEPAKRGRPPGTGSTQYYRDSASVWQARALKAEERVIELNAELVQTQAYKRRGDVLETAFIGVVRALALTPPK